VWCAKRYLGNSRALMMFMLGAACFCRPLLMQKECTKLANEHLMHGMVKKQAKRRVHLYIHHIMMCAYTYANTYIFIYFCIIYVYKYVTHTTETPAYVKRCSFFGVRTSTQMAQNTNPNAENPSTHKEFLEVSCSSSPHSIFTKNYWMFLDKNMETYIITRTRVHMYTRTHTPLFSTHSVFLIHTNTNMPNMHMHRLNSVECNLCWKCPRLYMMSLSLDKNHKGKRE